MLPNANNYEEGFALEVSIDGILYYYVAKKDERVGIYLPVYKVGAAKSLLFAISFEDTLSAGDRVQDEEDIRSRIAVPYTDVNGRLEKAKLKFINYINPQWISGQSVDFVGYRNTAKNSPALLLGNVNRGGNYKEYASGEYEFFKDVGEKLEIMKQLQLLGYKRDIIVGNEWARLSNLILDLPGPSLYIYTNDDEYYELNEDKKIKIDAVQEGIATDLAARSNGKLILNTTGQNAVAGKASWAIGDSDKNLWIAVNQFEEDITVLSFVGTEKQPDVIHNVADDGFVNKVGWVDGGLVETDTTQCNTVDDVGNVRCTTYTTCSWIIINTYTSTTNDTTPTTTCEDGATRIRCFEDPNNPGSYSCSEEVADERNITTCETCSIL